MKIRVHAKVEILGIGPAVAEEGAGIGATCAVKISTGEDSFMMYEVYAFAKHENSLKAAILNAVLDRVAAVEEQYQRHTEREGLRERTPKTMDFELDMDEGAFEWIVEEQKKHPI